jgi:hypothetical protein
MDEKEGLLTEMERFLNRCIRISEETRPAFYCVPVVCIPGFRDIPRGAVPWVPDIFEQTGSDA